MPSPEEMLSSVTSYSYSPPGVLGARRQMGSELLSGTCATLYPSLYPQIPREKMFQTGGLIVLCGLLAQTTALLEVLPLPLDKNMPLVGTPPQAPHPTDLDGSLISGK